jgi:hypothetical protein
MSGVDIPSLDDILAEADGGEDTPAGTFGPDKWQAEIRHGSLKIMVPSSDPKKPSYMAILFDDGMIDCSCPGFTYRSSCRHSKAIQEVLNAKRAGDE